MLYLRIRPEKYELFYTTALLHSVFYFTVLGTLFVFTGAVVALYFSRRSTAMRICTNLFVFSNPNKLPFFGATWYLKEININRSDRVVQVTPTDSKREFLAAIFVIVAVLILIPISPDAPELIDSFQFALQSQVIAGDVPTGLSV